MLDTLYAIWCELGNLLGVLLAGALLVAVQEIRKRLQKQMETADKKLDAVTATVTEVARVTNGRLDEALKAAADATECATKFRLLWEAEHKLLTELNALPEGRALLDSIAKRHRIVVHDEALNEVIHRLLRTPPGDGGKHD